MTSGRSRACFTRVKITMMVTMSNDDSTVSFMQPVSQPEYHAFLGEGVAGRKK